LFIAVTAHGYGHVAQVAPVVAEMVQQLPNLRVTVQGTVDTAYVASRLPAGFRHVKAAADVALPMDGPLQVGWDEGLERYTRFEAEYGRHMAAQLARFEQDPPDLVLADIPWLPLDAARRLGIPAVGLCSLSWYDILLGSPVAARVPAAVAERLRGVYARGDLFLRPAPSMPMAWLPNGRDIGPLAVQRRRDPDGLRQRLGIPPDRRLVLVQFGGAGRLPLGGGGMDGVCFLTPDAAAAEGRDDVVLIGTGDRPGVPDVLPCCDALITKPGYGTFAEAACNGIPVLYVPRGDWPEEPHLVEWLARQVPVQAMAADDLAAGRVEAPLQALFSAGITTPVAATGAAEATLLLRGLMSR
jgi:hypothetical protein